MTQVSNWFKNRRQRDRTPSCGGAGGGAGARWGDAWKEKKGGGGDSGWEGFFFLLLQSSSSHWSTEKPLLPSWEERILFLYASTVAPFPPPPPQKKEVQKIFFLGVKENVPSLPGDLKWKFERFFFLFLSLSPLQLSWIFLQRTHFSLSLFLLSFFIRLGFFAQDLAPLLFPSPPPKKEILNFFRHSVSLIFIQKVMVY